MNLKFEPETDLFFRQCIKMTTSPYSLQLALANQAEEGCSGALAPKKGSNYGLSLFIKYYRPKALITTARRDATPTRGCTPIFAEFFDILNFYFFEIPSRNSNGDRPTDHCRMEH
jgi:hypothetical protein